MGLGIRKVAVSIVVALASAVLSPAPGRAADPFDQAVNRGIKAMKRGDYDAALASFLEAQDRRAEPRVTAQIGAAEQALGRYVAAEAHLVEALSANTDPWIKSREPLLLESLAEVRKHIGRLMIVGSPDGAEVRVDGSIAAVVPLRRALTLPVGRVSIRLSSPGFVSVERSVDVLPNQRALLSMFLVRRETPPAPVVEPAHVPTRPGMGMPPAADSRTGIKTACWVSLVAGGLLATTGALVRRDHERAGNGMLLIGLGGVVGASFGFGWLALHPAQDRNTLGSIASFSSQ